KRFHERFYDSTFSAVAPEIEKVIPVAWKITSNTTGARGPGGQAPPSAILIFCCPSNGSKLAAPSNRRKNVRRIADPTRGFSSSTARPPEPQPVREKCRKPFVWRKWPKKLFQGTKVSRWTFRI